MEDEYIEYEVVEDTKYNTCNLQWHRLPIGTRFFATANTHKPYGERDQCVSFRREGNPTGNNYIPIKYLKRASTICIGGE